MLKIAFIGAGSISFTRRLVTDILSQASLQKCTLSLMDIDSVRLKCAKKCVERIVEEGKFPAKVEATLDRKKALKGAKYVVITILAGDIDVFRPEIEIPKKYGVEICIGDTLGPAGVFRALRTIPVMLDICRDIERICPEAFILNYTNPMSMNCRAVQRKTSLKFVGLCHSVQGIAEMLARWIGAPIEEIDFLCAGINHQAWFLEYKWNGKHAYPLIRKAIEKNKNYEEEIVLCEIFKHLDYFVTESSGHNSEYNAWFRKRPDLLKRYCFRGTGWNPGYTGAILKFYEEDRKRWQKKMRKFSESKKPIDLAPSHEYASYILNAIETDEAFKFNGNVRNTGLITNLPRDCCVEVPVIADRRGFQPLYVGALPPQLAALNNMNISVQEMAVEAA
ncbi:alpha-galactosidase, partial [bacterium]|nr:alpha-galactosidase [bacterium]